MLGFGSLWLPVVLTAVAVFIASSVIWMALPIHRADWKKLPDEDGIAAAITKSGAGAGQYMLPYCTHGPERKSPEFMAKFEKGPVGVLVLRTPGPMTMGPMLGAWFCYNLLVAFTLAYVSRHAFGAAAMTLPGMDIFRFFATGAFLVHGIAHVPESIWMGRPWSVTFRSFIDAAIYAGITGAVFCFLWPHA